MAHKLEEDFVISNLLPGSIFEFGGGNCSWATRIPDRQIEVIDLYPPIDFSSNVRYTSGNFLDYSFDKNYSNIVALSAFEHAGIESFNFEKSCVNLNEINDVAKKLTSLLGPDSRLLITVPAGLDEIYGVYKNGEDSIFTEGDKCIWGYRAFTLDGLLSYFPGLKVIDTKAYLRISKDIDYFDKTGWVEISSSNITTRRKEQNALLCVALEK